MRVQETNRRRRHASTIRWRGATRKKATSRSVHSRLSATVVRFSFLHVADTDTCPWGVSRLPCLPQMKLTGRADKHGHYHDEDDDF